MQDRPRAWADLALAAAACCGAGLALALGPASPLRILLVAPLLAFLPGYLLLQALTVPRPPGPAWARQAAFSLGLTPPLVGLLAFSTSLVEGGFRPVPIAVAVVGASVALAALAAVRRRATRTGEGGGENAGGEGGPPKPAGVAPKP